MILKKNVSLLFRSNLFFTHQLDPILDPEKREMEEVAAGGGKEIFWQKKIFLISD